MMKTAVFHRPWWAVPVGLMFLAALIAFTGCDDDGVSATVNNTFTVSMTDIDTFSPAAIAVRPGARIIWINNDGEAHTATTDPLNLAAGGPDSDVVYSNGVPPNATYTFIVPGDTPIGTVWFYHCRFHGVPGDGFGVGAGMAGSIRVVAR